MGVRRFFLSVSRFALSAWVGAAILFVVNQVLLVSADAFESVHRDHMALLRFPPYYLFGAVMVGSAFVSLLAAPPFRGRWAAVGLVVLSIIGMIVDYLFVYLPLARMITPPGQPRTAQFMELHHQSEVINTVHVGLCLLAALIVCYARPTERET